eukprot:CAMPEP_0197030488 /NCGR_PEP_ID=MMETSP1384-20130603/9713_1 /TAXON_ID=29189 /ORGANISM="Ammonia sp." /LENGTH=396 /DNA_ID=CAMNT_0042459853 /DNA_START=46 /DNA_END=1236 /DNA_ORIENTATION=-
MTARATKLPLFEVSGNSPYELGYNYGVTLKPRIQATAQLYYEVFLSLGATDAMLKAQCSEYEQLMRKHCVDLSTEIEGISKGSEMPLWRIYAVNCRTEILNTLKQQQKDTVSVTNNECSGILNLSSCINAQNWDWLQDMEDNSVLLRMRKRDKTLLMVIEPGMVGKIGLNNYGIGVTLMLLARPKFFDIHKLHQNASKGLPIHVILRLFLECKSLNEVDRLLTSMTTNTYSCIGVADDKHNGYFVEFCGFNKFDKLYASQKRFSFHTNHYLGCGLKYIGTDEAAATQGSCSLPRYEQLRQLYAYKKCKNDNKFDTRTEVLKELLTNDMHKDQPICREFKAKSAWKGKKTGTVTTIIMNLKRKSMHLSRGSPLRYPFETVFVDEYDGGVASEIHSKL